MTEPFIGEICLFPYNFAPRGWALCNGQILPIAQNTALFSLLGTTYGGNGQTTFGLPDLRGRVPISSGQGLGLANRALGEAAGTESVTLTASQVPTHNHQVAVNATDATTSRPNGNYAATGGSYNSATDGTSLNSAAVSNSGGSQPHDNMPPYLTLNYCIALDGIYPSRS